MNQMTVRQEFESRSAAEPAEIRQAQPALNELNSRYAQLTAIRAGVKARRQRELFFNAKLFADPAWDMLLELYAASLADRRLTVSRLAERSLVPMTTALRWIAALQAEGLIDRRDDPFDKRRYFLSLSDKGTNAMKAYFAEIGGETKLL